MLATETSLLWSVGLVSIISGLVIGLGIAYLTNKDKIRAKQLQNELDALEQRFTDYRNQVSEHFLQTSELVDKMTSSYREVYEHLAKGSESLCSDSMHTPALDLPNAGIYSIDTSPETEISHDEFGEDMPSQDNADGQLGDAPHVPEITTEFDTKEDRTSPMHH